MAKEFIIAIELGSSKVTGIAGTKNIDGSLNVLAVVKEDSKSSIRKGVVYKSDKAAECLKNIINKLRNNLKTNIDKVYVGIGGQGLHSVKNVIVREYEQPTIVSQAFVDGVLDTNRAMSYSEQKILEAVPLEFKVDSQYQIDPLGIQCKRLEGNMLNILCRNSFVRMLRTCLESAGISVFDTYLTPLTLADSVLTDGEMRSGCLLVDLGADTATVSVYYRNILRFLTVVPLGSANITKDIESLSTDEETAEKLKLKYGTAVLDGLDADDNRKVKIDTDRTVEYSRLVELIQARAEEIVRNVWNMVPEEYRDKLLGGIVLTGGGSNMTGIDKLFRDITKVEKVRIADFISQHVSYSNCEPLAHDGTMNGVLSLLLKGEENCAGAEIDDSLFGNSSHVSPTFTTTSTATDAQTASAVQGNAADSQQTTDTAAAQQHTVTTTVTDEEEDDEEEEETVQRKPSVWGKFMTRVKDFGHAIVTGESDDKSV